MIYGLYAMRDERTGFLTPVPEQNDAAAIRNFFHTVQNSDGILFSFASDFRLYRIGQFDSDSGSITTLSPVEFIASGSDAVAALPKEVSKDA